MGTNYYAIKKEDLKNIHREYPNSEVLQKLYPAIEDLVWKFALHIGKSSGGYVFRFEQQEEYSSFKELLNFLKYCVVMDEYDRIIDIQEFVDLVKSKQNSELNVVKNHDYLDDDGYLFTLGAFA